jgi:hypothetical protein
MSGDKRRLASILAADLVGYSAMIAADESATLARVRALRSETVESLPQPRMTVASSKPRAILRRSGVPE